MNQWNVGNVVKYIKESIVSYVDKLFAPTIVFGDEQQQKNYNAYKYAIRLVIRLWIMMLFLPIISFILVLFVYALIPNWDSSFLMGFLVYCAGMTIEFVKTIKALEDKNKKNADNN